MPYVSQAQRRFMHVKHPEIAKRWDKEFPNQKGLPERIGSKHKQAQSIERKIHKSMGIKTKRYKD